MSSRVLKKGKMRENHPKFVPSQHPFLVQNKVFQHPARYTEDKKVTTIKQAIDGFLLSCKVEYYYH